MYYTDKTYSATNKRSWMDVDRPRYKIDNNYIFYIYDNLHTSITHI